MVSAIVWVVELAKFVDRPHGINRSIDLGLNWPSVKAQINAGKSADDIECIECRNAPPHR